MSASEPRTAVQARTRRAILDAAIGVLAGDFSASLGEIARAAGVGRTTLHRYFPERVDLLNGISLDGLEQISAAFERARLGDGPVLDALDRLCQQLFELGDVLWLLFNEARLMEGPAWEEETAADRALLATLARGQREGEIDAALPPEWIQLLIWSLLYSAWEHVRTNEASKHEALSLCLRTLRKSIAD